MVLRVALLIIGLLGLALGIYGLLQGEPLTAQLLPLICGLSLIYGYFYFRNRN